MTIDVNGIAHIQLNVNDPARCLPFWEKLCHFLGMSTLIKGDEVIYCIGGRTGILVRATPYSRREVAYDQDRAGLHHFCFRARSRDDVDAVHRFLVDELAARIVHAPDEGSEFAPGYYSVLFEDPDGIRVEVNHIPGKGHFGAGGRLGPEGPGPSDRYAESDVSLAEARVHLVPYDASWPACFEEERALLTAAIGEWIVGAIEHVGSTAVPGLAAKPVIDIVVGVESLDRSRPALGPLERLGYLYAPYKTDVMHWLCKPSRTFRTHHLHLVPFGSPLWQERLAFRDYLRAHPAAAQEYEALKRKLAAEHELDREAYTDAKAPFVEAILARLR